MFCYYQVIRELMGVTFVSLLLDYRKPIPNNMMLLGHCCQLCRANVGSTTLAHHLTALWAFVGSTCWANVGPMLFIAQLRKGHHWANIVIFIVPTLAHCLTAYGPSLVQRVVYTIGSSLGHRYVVQYCLNKTYK